MSDSSAKPAAVLTPAQIIETVTALDQRVKALETARTDVPQAVQAQNAGPTTGLAETIVEGIIAGMAQIGAHPGLCSNKSCAPCRTAARQLIDTTRAHTRREFLGELGQAATFGNCVREADTLASAFEKWQAAGRPTASQAPFDPIPSTADVDDLVKLGE